MIKRCKKHLVDTHLKIKCVFLIKVFRIFLSGGAQGGNDKPPHIDSAMWGGLLQFSVIGYC